ncbi:extracellular solute-binding protein [Oceanobacillus longus]|uniref:Extracellular solute-binding protein n=1 Tax=Oceanobacillus longus TaxID=930120 RepID=A0ABV8H2H5_9BACI
MRKNWLLVLFVSILLMLAACSDDSGAEENEEASAGTEEASSNVNQSGFPIVDDPISLHFLAGKHPTTADDYNEVLVWENYAEMTNIDIEWELVQSAGLEEKRNLALASGSLPDVFYTSYMPNSDLLKYGEQEVFIELNDLIEAHMPNLTAVLEEYPEIRKGLTFPNGNIYALPTIYSPDFPSVLIGSKPWVKQDWLEQLDMEVPSTTDDYYEFLKAVKETDLNGNGENDEIAFGATNISGLVGWMKGSFGVGNRGIKHPFIDADPNSGDARFFPINEGYKNMLEYINKLYSEGLIQENIYTIETNQSYANGSEGLYGSTVITSPETIYGEEGKNYVAMPALEGPNGEKSFNKVGSPLAHMGGFVVTSENENPAATLRWMDHFYSDEGATLYFMGEEGVTYEKTEDGSLEYVDEIQNSPDGLTLEQELSKYITWLGGGYPGIVKSDYFNGAESLPSSLEATEIIEPDLTEEAWSVFTYTDEENNRLTALQADIHTYVNEMQDQFITGDVPFSEWDSYVETIESMGLEEYMEIQQAALDRYESN